MNQRLTMFRASASFAWCQGAFLALTLGACAVAAQAQSVAMTGGMGSKALLVINGGSPKALAAGDEHKGVKVVSVTGDATVVDVGGKRQTVRLGGAPVSLGGAGGGGSASQIVLTAGSGGHFMTQGSINGKSVDFMVDTGATTIALSADDAKRMGIKYEDGQKAMSQTANGTRVVHVVRLSSVRIKDVEVYDVEAVVGDAPMPFALLGNSFLTRFQMKRENDIMTLTKKP
jgi:aspartyl protease family protein